jgi:hypothetical protein
MQTRRTLVALAVILLAILSCNIGVPAPTAVTPTATTDILTLAAETLQAQSPTAAPGITVDQALTLAVETLQSQPTSPAATLPPASNPPKPTKTPKPTTAPPTPTNTPHPINTKPPLHINLTRVVIGPIQPINPKLDYTANASYGQANLSAGFSPDPYQVGMTAGGNVDVSYLGGTCSGYATTAPDLRINFGGGGSPLLRIYFIGVNGDPAMVLNDPYGNFYCVDDSFGTVNPTIDFNNPAGGTYDVWIASYAANTTISGTLYITENSGNHP